MTRHERLVENYEDAYFALLMEEVAQKEGERLEKINQDLQNNPLMSTSKELDWRCRQAIRRHFVKETRSKRLRTLRKILQIAAVVIALGTMIFTTAFAISEEVRVTTANLVLTVMEDHTMLSIHTDAAENAEKSTTTTTNSIDSSTYFDTIQIQWIPEGFHFYAGKQNLWVRFENSEGDWFTLVKVQGSDINVDTEAAESVEEIIINGRSGLRIVKSGETHIVIADIESSIYLDLVVSPNISAETSQKIVENIEIN